MSNRSINYLRTCTFICISMFVVLVAINTAKGEAKNDPYYDVTDYGAANDGQKRVDKAIKKAVEAAVAAGGGTVYFPAGEYLTGPIYLESNITIYIESGATLRFSDNFDDYLPMVPSRWEGTDVVNFSPLFYAYEEENIAIRGRGTIDGQGKKWWDFHHKLYDKKTPRSKWQDIFAENNKNVTLPDQPGMIKRGFLRPPFIQPLFCKNVLIEGITIINSPFWTVNPEYCENVNITGVTIINPDSPNTDGINPSSCKYVHISNCHISVGDDCITIKSGRDQDGRNRAIPAENYTITNCTMLSGHGGVVIGSEMSGGVKEITISNCVFDGTDRGIRIKSMRGRGGVVEDIRVSNIIMKDIKDQAIILNMHYGDTEPEPVSERTPRFRNIHFNGITAKGVNKAGEIKGLEEMPVENITFHDIVMESEQGFTVENARNIEFHSVTINTNSGASLKAKNVDVIEVDGFKSMSAHEGTPVVELTNVRGAFIHSAFSSVADIYLKLSGERTKDIVLDNNNFTQVKTPVLRTEEVSVEAGANVKP